KRPGTPRAGEHRRSRRPPARHKRTENRAGRTAAGRTAAKGEAGISPRDPARRSRGANEVSLADRRFYARLVQKAPLARIQTMFAQDVRNRHRWGPAGPP